MIHHHLLIYTGFMQTDSLFAILTPGDTGDLRVVLHDAEYPHYSNRILIITKKIIISISILKLSFLLILYILN